MADRAPSNRRSFRLRVGPMDKYLAVQQDLGGATSETNEQTPSWTTEGSRWFRIDPLKGDEFVRVRQVHSTATHKVTGWWESGLYTTKKRLLDVAASRSFEINEVRNIGERSVGVELICTEALAPLNE